MHWLYSDVKIGCRVRFGYAHVANNRYDEWKMYAIGGSADPTIFSEGNYFIAPDISSSKQVHSDSHPFFLRPVLLNATSRIEIIY